MRITSNGGLLLSNGILVERCKIVTTAWSTTNDISLDDGNVFLNTANLAGTTNTIDITSSAGLNVINDLRPVTYNWRANYELPEDFPGYNPVEEENEMTTDVKMHGLIAQEVKEAIDNAGEARIAGWKEDPDGVQRISKEMYVFPLIKAVQELSEKVESQQKEIEELKKR